MEIRHSCERASWQFHEHVGSRETKSATTTTRTTSTPATATSGTARCTGVTNRPLNPGTKYVYHRTTLTMGLQNRSVSAAFSGQTFSNVRIRVCAPEASPFLDSIPTSFSRSRKVDSMVFRRLGHWKTQGGTCLPPKRSTILNFYTLRQHLHHESTFLTFRRAGVWNCSSANMLWVLLSGSSSMKAASGYFFRISVSASRTFCGQKQESGSIIRCHHFSQNSL